MKSIAIRSARLALPILAVSTAHAEADELWSHLQGDVFPGDGRHLRAEWEGTGPEQVLRLTFSEKREKQAYAWVTVPAPEEGWDLARRKKVKATITNQSSAPANTMLWAVGTHGWSAIGDFHKLAPGESREFACELRETFPDGTPKLDPNRIGKIEIMVRQIAPGTVLEIAGLRSDGDAPEFEVSPGRIEVPEWDGLGKPAPGRRVRHKFGDGETKVYAALFLPEAWKEDGRYPVIVEFPGNIFLNAKCYSTGRPEQCVIGYGMSEGKAIWVSLPFIEHGGIVENGFGNADDTRDFTVRVVDDICRNFGGDPDNVILTGFSRGSIACGYIGLRDDTIAGLWKGIHGCQHYDGSNWHESNIEGAVKRAPRFSGKAIFQTDNSEEKYRPVVEATRPDVEWTWVRSGLGFHDTAMFLDGRPSTLQLRRWYRELVGNPREPSSSGNAKP